MPAKAILKPIKFKVIAYILRRKSEGFEILVFDHLDFPEAGVQVVGGTVEENEDPKFALIREIKEESGLEYSLNDLQYIGESEYLRKDKPEINLRKYYKILSNNLNENWVHHVASNGEDNGLKFYFYWLTIDQAKEVLTGNFSEFLDQV